MIWLKNGYAPTQRVKKGLVLNDGHNHSIMVKVDFKGYIRQLAVGSLNRRIIQINKNHNINVRILAEIVSGVRPVKKHLFQVAAKYSGDFLNIPIENRTCYLSVFSN